MFFEDFQTCTKMVVEKTHSHVFLIDFEVFGYVVVQFGFWFNLDFPLFFSMLINDDEYQTMENPN